MTELLTLLVLQFTSSGRNRPTPTSLSLITQAAIERRMRCSVDMSPLDMIPCYFMSYCTNHTSPLAYCYIQTGLLNGQNTLAYSYKCEIWCNHLLIFFEVPTLPIKLDHRFQPVCFNICSSFSFLGSASIVLCCLASARLSRAICLTCFSVGLRIAQLIWPKMLVLIAVKAVNIQSYGLTLIQWLVQN